MAKRFDNGFDAEGFVDKFRATDGTITSSIPVEKPTTENQDQTEKPVEQKDSQSKPKSYPRQTKQNSITPEDYQEKFIDNLKFRYPVNIWKSVKIHPDFITIIQRLITATGSRRTSFSSFINNVLEEHFREHETEINKLLENDK